MPGTSGGERGLRLAGEHLLGYVSRQPSGVFRLTTCAVAGLVSDDFEAGDTVDERRGPLRGIGRSRRGDEVRQGAELDKYTTSAQHTPNRKYWVPRSWRSREVCGQDTFTRVYGTSPVYRMRLQGQGGVEPDASRVVGDGHIHGSLRQFTTGLPWDVPNFQWSAWIDLSSW